MANLERLGAGGFVVSFKAVLRASSALLLIGVAATRADAQVAQPGGDSPSASDPAATSQTDTDGVASAAADAQARAADPAQTGDSGGLEEITVTAQRRSQNLQDVPVSITAVSPVRLEQLNVRTIDQLQAVTPGFVFNTGYTYSQIFIRGVGANFPNPGLEPAVATYIDGAYTQRGFGALYDLLDVDTVQILKGPQGTLYGRNATGGAILINSRAPINEFEARAVGEIGNLDRRLLDAIVNVPLGETLAARVAVRYRNDGGYVRNLFTGNKLGDNEGITARGRLAFTPSSDFKATFTFQYDKNEGSTGPAAQRLPFITTVNNLTGPFAIYNGWPIVTSIGSDPTSFPGTLSPVPGFYQTDQNEDSVDGRDGSGGTSYFYNLQLEGNLGDIRLRSVTAFRNQDDFGISDLDFTRVLLFQYGQFSGSETFTQELTANFDIGERLSGIVGLSYLNDDGYFRFVFDGFGFRAAAAASPSRRLPEGLSSVKTKSYSGFAELTFEPIDGLKITGGGRYTKDKRRLDGSFNDTTVGAFGLPEAAFTTRTSFNSFTPRVVVAYDAGPLNVYASYNKGFKAGGYSTPALVRPAGELIVKPEKITSYEVGAKFQSRDRRIRANIAAFYYDYKDVQVTVTRLDLGGAIVQNGAKAEGKGIEFDGQFQPVEWLTIFGGAAYLDTEFKNFPNAAGAGPGGPVTAPTFVNTSEDLVGFPLARSPKFSGNIGATLASSFGNGFKGDLTGYVRYSDSYAFGPGAGGPLRTDVQPSFTVVDISGNVGPENDRYSIGLFINNLTNEKYKQFGSSAANFGAFDFVARPRTYGLRLRASY